MPPPAGGRPQRPRRHPPRLGLRPGPGRIDVRQNDIGRPNPRDASGESRDCKDLSDTCAALSLQCHSDGHPVPGVHLTRPSCSTSDRAGEIAGLDDVLSTQSHGAKERRIPFVPDRDSSGSLPPFPLALPDLEPEVNRSRRGIRPISMRGRRGPRAAGAGPAPPDPARAYCGGVTRLVVPGPARHRVHSSPAPRAASSSESPRTGR